MGKNIELPVSISLGGVTAEPGYSIQASHTGDSVSFRSHATGDVLPVLLESSGYNTTSCGLLLS